MKLLLPIVLIAFLPAALAAQTHDHAGAGRWSVHWGAQAIPLATLATPAQHGRDLLEGYLSQPSLFLHTRTGPLTSQFTINLEGFTLRRGELNAGTWGEGYIDRRHPHTFLHEAVLTADAGLAAGRWSLSTGKGFAPFGTDDPMARPFLKFPANHHLTQVLERLVLIGAARYGAFGIEAGLFNGDEPLRPESLGTVDRFADSWATRITVRPLVGLEVQASLADLESPEQPAGSSLDQRKWDLSARYEKDGRYLLLEWARTAELSDGREVLALHSALAEASLLRAGWRTGLRLERTVRPEQERSSSIFRSPWPHADERTWGLTRWVIASANVSREFSWRGLRAAPVLEVGRQWATPTVEPALFAPESLFGSDRLWSFTLGMRLGAGTPHMRMGRYGAAQ